MRIATILVCLACCSARAEDVTVQSQGASLAATIQFPQGNASVPGAVLVHGSGRMTRGALQPMADRLTALGFAVIYYDKRGTGGSTGDYANVGPRNSDLMFGELAGDASAALAVLKTRSRVDAKRLGFCGASQAGWIIPLAASRTPFAKFQIILSGPATSVGREIHYSNLAGSDPGSIQGLGEPEIARRMSLFKGLDGFNNVPILEKLAVPSVWVIGEADRSIPVGETLAALERLRKSGRPVTVVKIPGADHGLRVGGTPAMFWHSVRDWLVEGAIIPRR